MAYCLLLKVSDRAERLTQSKISTIWLHCMQFGDRPHPQPGAEFDTYATHLGDIARKVTDEAEGAFTIGIFGSWGSGKTTLMRLIQKKIKELKDSKYKCIWFNAWKYDGKEAIWNALIQTILLEMKEDETNVADLDNWRQTYEMVESNMNLYVHYLATQIPGALSKKILGIELVPDKLKEIDILYNVDKKHYRFVNRFEDDFKQLVTSYVGKGKLIVFIDDLDRCLPENALTVLEAIKLYLDNANCVFFIGVDKKIIEQGVRKRYLASLKITGKDYIEKMIQLDFYLPYKAEKELIKLLKGRIGRQWSNDEEMWEMIIQGSDSNIRKVKRFLHSFNLMEKIADDIGTEKKFYPKLSRILLIQMNLPEFFAELVRKYKLILEKKDVDMLKTFLEDFPENSKFRDSIEISKFITTTSNYGMISERKELEMILQLLRTNAQTS